MAGICENGHRSTTDDYCDTCGAPVHPAPRVGPTPPAVPSTTQKCPNCGASNPADALFCEACGYDYTTGTLPRSDVAGMLGLRRDPSPTNAVSVGAPAAAPIMSARTRPGRTVSPTPVAVASPPHIDESSAAPPALASEPAASEPVADAAAAPAPSEAAADPVQPLTPPPVPDQAPRMEGSPVDDEQPTRGRPAPRRESYVAEIWIDPDWYEVQETDEPMPSVGLPTTVVLGPDNLVGRVSESRNIHPQVDCGVDSGVSRRQSRLSTDGTRWYVEDLGSANGTFVGPASGPLPVTPITGRYELGPDDRVYVGAWTRIVVRKASKEEIDALS
jgi:hypothetical protein